MKLLSSTVQAALEWLEANQDKPLDEIKAATTNETREEEEGPALKEGEEPRSLVCNVCGKKFRSHAQAEFHASKTEHVDFSESTEEIAPLTEEEKKARLTELREKLAAKRAGQLEQDKIDKKRNEVGFVGRWTFENFCSHLWYRRFAGKIPRNHRILKKSYRERNDSRKLHRSERKSKTK